MYNLEFFRLYVLTENSFNQTNLVEAKVEGETDSTTKPQIELIPPSEHLVAPICLIILWASAAFLFISNVWKFRQNGKLTINPFSKVPCCNCQYFDENSYLNCAVNPSIVLTKQASDCPDYCPKQ